MFYLPNNFSVNAIDVYILYQLIFTYN